MAETMGDSDCRTAVVVVIDVQEGWRKAEPAAIKKFFEGSAVLTNRSDHVS